MDRVILDIKSRGIYIKENGFTPIEVKITLRDNSELKTFQEIISSWDTAISDALLKLIKER